MPMPQANISGELHRLCLLRIETVYENGQPAQLTLVREEDTVELAKNPRKNRFIVAWVKASACSPRPLEPGDETYP